LAASAAFQGEIMKAFHGDEAVKQKYLARLKAHHEADEIIQGTGWENGHGCAVGCTLNKYNHSAYECELGLPKWLAHLEDRIFEGLPPVDAQRFAVDFLEAVPIGADVESVRWQLASQRHTRDRDRLLPNPEPYAKQCVKAINLVIAYCDSQDKTEAARSAAWSAAWSAARSAWSAARSARSAARSARSAARSARSAAAARSAESAAWSARSAAESASVSDHFKWEAETLLALLRNAPQATE
jgi:hypothetical protein